MWNSVTDNGLWIPLVDQSRDRRILTRTVLEELDFTWGPYVTDSHVLGVPRHLNLKCKVRTTIFMTLFWGFSHLISYQLEFWLLHACVMYSFLSLGSLLRNKSRSGQVTRIILHYFGHKSGACCHNHSSRIDTDICVGIQVMCVSTVPRPDFSRENFVFNKPRTD